MPITFQSISPSDIALIKTRSETFLKQASDKRLLAMLVYLLWSVKGDMGDIDLATLETNTNAVEGQMSEEELRAAVIYQFWASVNE